MNATVIRDACPTALTEIERLIGAGRWVEVGGRCAALAHSTMDDPHTWTLAAEIALRCKQLEAAAEASRRAVECLPNDAALLISYANILMGLGQRPQARQVALRIQKLSVTNSAMQDALGTLLTRLDYPALALPHFQRALTAQPQNIDYRYNLAMAQRMTGALELAEANLDRVIQERPNDAEAYHARSDLRTQTVERNHVSQLKSAQRRLAGRRAVIPISFALAKELEDLGDYRTAFSHLHAACRSYRATLRYDVSEDVAVLDRLRVRHTKATLEQLRAKPFGADNIFIVGLPRSGTTLVERILGSHSDIHAGGETDAFQTVVVSAIAQQERRPVKKLDFVDCSLKTDFSALGAAYVQAVAERDGPAKLTDKLPFNYLYAGLIHAALPAARFIALRRHPLDSCYAMYKTLFASAYPFTYSLEDLARYYVAWERLMQHWQTVLGDAWLTVDYEDLVNHPETIGRRMLAHCGLEWQTRCLEFHAQPVAVTTASAAQVRRPIHQESVGKWRHYADELQPLRRVLYELDPLSARSLNEA